MLYIFYRPASEHEREIAEFQRRLEQKRVPYQLVDLNTRDGAAKAQTYGIMQFPAVLAARESDGQSLQIWTGLMPTISDAERYARNSL